MATLVSEKAAEILFNRYMLQWFGLGKAQLFAPTSPEEFVHGYDAKVVGFPSLRELYLQFKAPSYSKRDMRFAFDLTPHQHHRLRAYPTGSAYYVAAHFVSLKHLNEAQASVSTTEDFLRYFVCVDAAAVDADARSITFSLPPSHRHSPDPGFKGPSNGKSPRDFQRLRPEHWDRGNTLIARLKQGQVGRVVRLARDGAAPSTDAEELGQAAAKATLTPKEWKELGSFVRLPLSNEASAG